MTAAIYARKSTEQRDVDDEQKSVTRQIAHARAYAQRRGWIVDDDAVFVDDGISGANFVTRPGFLRLMNELKPRPRFQVLVMSEESRLGRESIETAYALKQLIQAGVRVFFYLEDRERTLDSPLEKIMLSLTAFADEIEREKARQRTYDAMRRKAESGHVTGGRVFGYDNVEVRGADGKRSHVGRRINEVEASIVREIFQCCADGAGYARIARALNDAHAAAPAAQQGRPTGWAPSSVRAILFRPLYRGELVWNRTRKRDRWGLRASSDRPRPEWITLPAPALAIVSDELWQAAHDRLANVRARYLTGTNGRVYGRPHDVESKYLLPGFARCARCNGGLHVRSRSHGQRRAYFYACTSHFNKGRTVCQNGLEVSMERIDAEVWRAIAGELLAPELVNDVIASLLAELEPEKRLDVEHRIEREIATVEREAQRFVEAIAAGGNVPALVEALRVREARHQALKTELARARWCTALDRRRIEAHIRKRLKKWQDCFTADVATGRAFLREILEGPILFTPVARGQRRGYSFRGTVVLGGLLTGIVDGSTTTMASPSGRTRPYVRVFKADFIAA